MEKIKLNLGCASRLLDGYINIDIDSIDSIKSRYPNVKVDDNRKFMQGNIFNLDFSNETIDEIRADALIEHLSFKEEPLFFKEIIRLLKPGGLFRFETPDFEWTIKTWLEAKDDWLDFFSDTKEAIESKHWFGTHSYSFDNRWGYVMASIFGPQNSEGQFHKNAYTECKIMAICKKIGLDKPEITRYRWKKDRDVMLKVKVFKPLKK